MKRVIFLIMFVAMVSACSNQDDQDFGLPPTPENILGIEDDETELKPRAAQMIAGGMYTLNPSQSTLTYYARRIGRGEHTGTVGIAEGWLERKQDAYAGEFIIDMTTITETKDSQRYLSHVRSDDFFAVDTFPTAKILITEIDYTEKGYTVTGDLTIKDQTHSISFPATAATTDSGFTVTATFEIDRARWGITFDSGSFFQNLGDRAIKDEIQFTLDLAFDKN